MSLVQAGHLPFGIRIQFHLATTEAHRIDMGGILDVLSVVTVRVQFLKVTLQLFRTREMERIVVVKIAQGRRQLAENI